MSVNHTLQAMISGSDPLKIPTAATRVEDIFR
jgi:hypothetical protein